MVIDLLRQRAYIQCRYSQVAGQVLPNQFAKIVRETNNRKVFAGIETLEFVGLDNHPSANIREIRMIENGKVFANRLFRCILFDSSLR